MVYKQYTIALFIEAFNKQLILFVPSLTKPIIKSLNIILIINLIINAYK